jgi:hypothetical protein
MSGLFGSKSKSTTTTTPYSGNYSTQLDDFYNNYLKNNLDTSATPYTGDLTAGMTDTQNSAMSGLSSLLNTSALTGTINGDYLDPDTNPYLSQAYDEAESKVMKSLGTMNDNVNSQFNTNGLYNSSARMESLQKQADTAGDTLANIATNLYGNAYTQERQNQMNAINQESNLLGQQFNQGTTEQQTNQNADTNAYNEWLRQQNVDQNDINTMLQYFSLVKNPSQTTETTSSGGLGSLLGAGLYGLGSSYGGKIGAK